MVIQCRSPLAAPLPTRATTSACVPPERFTRGAEDDDEPGLTRAEAARIACTVLGAGAGAYAGLANGWLAGGLGAAAAALPCGIVGSIAAKAAGEKLFHTSESTNAGLAIVGGLAGLAGGAVGGFLLGSHFNSPVLAVGLGLLGAGSAIAHDLLN